MLESAQLSIRQAAYGNSFDLEHNTAPILY